MAAPFGSAPVSQESRPASTAPASPMPAGPQSQAPTPTAQVVPPVDFDPPASPPSRQSNSEPPPAVSANATSTIFGRPPSPSPAAPSADTVTPRPTDNSTPFGPPPGMTPATPNTLASPGVMASVQLNLRTKRAADDDAHALADRAGRAAKINTVNMTHLRRFSTMGELEQKLFFAAALLKNQELAEQAPLANGGLTDQTKDRIGRLLNSYLLHSSVSAYVGGEDFLINQVMGAFRRNSAWGVQPDTQAWGLVLAETRKKASHRRSELKNMLSKSIAEGPTRQNLYVCCLEVTRQFQSSVNLTADFAGRVAWLRRELHHTTRAPTKFWKDVDSALVALRKEDDSGQTAAFVKAIEFDRETFGDCYTDLQDNLPNIQVDAEANELARI